MEDATFDHLRAFSLCYCPSILNYRRTGDLTSIEAELQTLELKSVTESADRSIIWGSLHQLNMSKNEARCGRAFQMKLAVSTSVGMENSHYRDFWVNSQFRDYYYKPLGLWDPSDWNEAVKDAIQQRPKNAYDSDGSLRRGSLFLNLNERIDRVLAALDTDDINEMRENVKKLRAERNCSKDQQ